MSETIKPNGHTPLNREQVALQFPREFFQEDTSLAIQEPAAFLASSYAGDELVEKGAEVTVFLEAQYPDLMAEDPQLIAGRMSHTLVAALNVLRERENRPPLKVAERYGVIFSYSEALQRLETH